MAGYMMQEIPEQFIKFDKEAMNIFASIIVVKNATKIFALASKLKTNWEKNGIIEEDAFYNDVTKKDTVMKSLLKYLGKGISGGDVDKSLDKDFNKFIVSRKSRASSDYQQLAQFSVEVGAVPDQLPLLLGSEVAFPDRGGRGALMTLIDDVAEAEELSAPPTMSKIENPIAIYPHLLLEYLPKMFHPLLENGPSSSAPAPLLLPLSVDIEDADTLAVVAIDDAHASPTPAKAIPIQTSLSPRTSLGCSTKQSEEDDSDDEDDKKNKKGDVSLRTMDTRTSLKSVEEVGTPARSRKGFVANLKGVVDSSQQDYDVYTKEMQRLDRLNRTLQAENRSLRAENVRLQSTHEEQTRGMQEEIDRLRRQLQQQQQNEVQGSGSPSALGREKPRSRSAHAHRRRKSETVDNSFASVDKPLTASVLEGGTTEAMLISSPPALPRESPSRPSSAFRRRMDMLRS